MDIVFIGHFPPPVHGQAIATARIADLFRGNGLRLATCDIGSGQGSGPVVLRRLVRHLVAAWRILTSPAPQVYLTVNDHRGMILTVLLCAVARLLGKGIILHHHSRRYIDRRCGTMALLARVAGTDATHISQSLALAERLAAQYRPFVRRTLGFSNIGIVELPAVSPRPRGRVALGHMSNLSQEKGIGRVIEAFRRVVAMGVDGELVVAGPCSDDYSSHAIDMARREFGARFTYLGPVQGKAKADFFRAIDIFLFPSLYPAETQGIVNLEALSCGKPVIAFRLGCIERDIGQSGGLAVAREADFTEAVASYMGRYMADPAAASARARRRFGELLSAHAEEWRGLLALARPRPSLARPRPSLAVH